MFILLQIAILIVNKQLINQAFAKIVRNSTHLQRIDGGGEGGKKIILFVHFHKAAGTSVVKAFLKEYNPWWVSHHNGNPWSYSKGKEYIVEFWKYGNEEFERFLQEGRNNKTEFIATEWNFFEKFNDDYIKDVSLITCIRDPYDRFVSNLFFNQFEPEYIEDPSLWVAQNFTKQLGRMIDGHYKIDTPLPVYYNKPNYYVAFMNGIADRTYDYHLNQTHLEIAKERLALFEAIFILERPETFHALQKWLPKMENITRLHKGETREKSGSKIAWTREQFYRDNALDLEFYEYALNLSLSRLK